MNQKPNLLRQVLRTAFLVAIASLGAQAQDMVSFKFNTAAEANNWVRYWGAAPQTYTLDAARDVINSPSSGSLKVTVGFDPVAHAGDNQFAARAALNGDGNYNAKVVDAAKYDRLEFDLFWDPSSPQRASGDFGFLEVGLLPPDLGSQVMFSNGVNVPLTPGWQHLRFPVSTLDQTKLANIGGIILKMWGGDDLNGTATFWVDNVKLVPRGFVADFDTDTFVAQNAFWHWFGNATSTVAWDPAKDADNSPTSGSIKISADWTGTDGAQQFAESMSLVGKGNYNAGLTIVPSQYATFEFDLLWDSTSDITDTAVNTTGDPQGLGVGFMDPTANWAGFFVPNANQAKVTADDAWHHIVIPVDPTWGSIGALAIKKYFGSTTTGTMKFWIDNIKFVPATTVLPPPTLSIAKARKGLNLFTSQASAAFQRDSIRSIPADGVFWVGNANPVTYAMTLADVPSGTAFGGFQMHMIFAPNTTGGNSPDYSDPNAIMIDIRATATGGSATFRYKVNQQNGNGMLYGAGQLGTLNTTAVNGTWSVTFKNDNIATVTGPDGATKDFTIPPADAALFTGTTMGTYFGIQPNNVANVGQGVVITEIKITNGADVVVDDHFTTADPTQQVDPTLWSLKLDGGPSGIRVVDQEPSFWLRWTLPDADFTLHARVDVDGPEIDPGLTIGLNGTMRQVLIDPTTMPSPDHAFYYLVKPLPIP